MITVVLMLRYLENINFSYWALSIFPLLTPSDMPGFTQSYRYLIPFQVMREHLWNRRINTSALCLVSPKNGRNF